MISVSMVGIRGGGKTTALGLLHEGLTAYAVNDKKFQFEAALGSAPYIYEIVRRLRRGDWPEGTPEGSREEVKLTLRYKKTFGWSEMELDSYDISGEELKAVMDELSEKSKSMQQIIADMRQRKTLAAVLNSDVFIFIVDSLVCDPGHSKESEAKKADVDTFLGHLCLALQTYKKGTRGSIKALALVFSKYDITELYLPLGQVEYYSQDINQLPVDIGKEGQRQQSKRFEDVLRTYLPTTYNNLRFTLKNVEPDNLQYFRSGITTVKDEQTTKATITLPLSFTASEYIRIARWLSKI